MKRFITAILLVLFFSFPGQITAQGLTFDKAYQDYLYTRTVYENSYRDFESSKNAYLGNRTLSLRDEAKGKLLIMLRNRDQLMSTYLTALRTKISELPSLTPELKNGILGKLDTEVAWYTNHKTNYKDDDQLETLFQKNKEAETHQKESLIYAVNESLFDITLGEQQGLRVVQEQIFADLKEIINKEVEAGKLTLTPFNNWFNDVERSVQVLKDNETKASAELQKMYTQKNVNTKAYISAIDMLGNSIQPLAQLNQYLTEILTYIINHQ